MTGRLERRSFLARVLGAAFVSGGALSLVTGRSMAQQGSSRSCITDTDTTDRAGFGSGTGLTDSDQSDLIGRGTLTGVTDSDRSDIARRGRSGRCTRTGITDSDSGALGDRAQFGRGGGSRVTDSDTSDAAGGPRGSGVTDSDSGPNADPANQGRGRNNWNSVAPSSPANGATALPGFPWPPPRPTGQVRLPRDRLLTVLPASPSLYDVGQRLTSALDRAGYAEVSFYRAPKGFALVSRLERIEDDGRPAPGQFRYTPPGQEPFSLSNYIAGLFVAPVGFYRLIVFIVTEVAVVATGSSIDQSQARELLRDGADRLPGDYRDLPFGPNHELTALIYEFQKTGQETRLQLLNQGRLGARTHLERSGIYAALLSPR